MVPVFPRTMNTQQSASTKLQRLDGSPVRVLVVDDERNLTELLSMALRYEGWEVRTAASGAAAVRAARDFQPDAVALDMMLPDFDGLEVLRRMRGDNPNVPVLFLTAKDAVEDRVASGEEQHRDPRVVLAHPAQHLHAVHVRQHHVERHGVRLELAGGANRSHAGTCGLDLPALVPQCHAQQLGEVVLVVDDEHPWRSAVGAHELLGAGRERVHVLTVRWLSW